MATSDTIAYTMTGRDVIAAALGLIGSIADGVEPSAQDGLVGLMHLNMMLKTSQWAGRNQWRDEDVLGLPWLAGVAEAALEPRVIDVYYVGYVQSSTITRELVRWERGDYDSIPNKAAVGYPTCYSLVKDRDAIKLRLWPVPPEDITLNLGTARVIQDATLNDEIDVPQEWLETVVYALADRLAPVFGQSGTTEAQDVKVKAGMLIQEMRDMDRPASVFMKPWAASPYGGY